MAWVEWTAASVSLSKTKGNDINLINRPQMQNDTENEIGRQLFPYFCILVFYVLFEKRVRATVVLAITVMCFSTNNLSDCAK